METDERVTATTKAITIYPAEQYIITVVANQLFEGNESQAVRHMIREYAKRNLEEASASEPTPMSDEKNE